jgi:hypothetical protein
MEGVGKKARTSYNLDETALILSKKYKKVARGS